MEQDCLPKMRLQMLSPLGASLVGTFATTILGGLLIHQTIRLFRAFRSDARPLYLMIGLLCVLDKIQEAMAVYLCYLMLMSHMGVREISDVVWALRLVVATTGLVSITTHGFLVRRVSGSPSPGHACRRRENDSVPQATRLRKLVPYIATVLAAIELSFCISAAMAPEVDIALQFYAPIDRSLGFRALVDSVLCATSLYQTRSRWTTREDDDELVDIAMEYTVKTGLVSSVITFASWTMGTLMHNAFASLALYIVSSKVYCSSVLYSFNSPELDSLADTLDVPACNEASETNETLSFKA